MGTLPGINPRSPYSEHIARVAFSIMSNALKLPFSNWPVSYISQIPCYIKVNTCSKSQMLSRTYQMPRGHHRFAAFRFKHSRYVTSLLLQLTNRSVWSVLRMACHNTAISHGQGGAVQFVCRTDVRVACAYKRPCELPNDMTLKTKRRVRGYQSIQVFQIRAVQFPVGPRFCFERANAVA